jgi:hypothetical protein
MVREGNVVEMFVNRCRHRLYVSPKSEYQRLYFDKIEAEYELRKMQEDKQILTTFWIVSKKKNTNNILDRIFPLCFERYPKYSIQMFLNYYYFFKIKRFKTHITYSLMPNNCRKPLCVKKCHLHASRT